MRVREWLGFAPVRRLQIVTIEHAIAFRQSAAPWPALRGALSRAPRGSGIFGDRGLWITGEDVSESGCGPIYLGESLGVPPSGESLQGATHGVFT
jgi:hypothetical protein